MDDTGDRRPMHAQRASEVDVEVLGDKIKIERVAYAHTDTNICDERERFVYMISESACAFDQSHSRLCEGPCNSNGSTH